MVNILLSAATFLCVVWCCEANNPAVLGGDLPVQLINDLEDQVLSESERSAAGPGAEPQLPENQELRQFGRQCGFRRVLSRGQRATFQFRDYFRPYPIRRNCVWNFVPANRRVTLTVRCRGIYLGRGASLTFRVGRRVVARVEGYKRNLVVTSRGNTITAIFNSNFIRTRSSFTCTVTATERLTTTSTTTTTTTTTTSTPEVTTGTPAETTTTASGVTSETSTPVVTTGAPAETTT